ncbi:hypothetical protein CR513_06866, partial [Mucuna pruriens]
MSGIDLDFLCHRLSISPKTYPRKLRKEKRKAAREETDKLLSARFIREVRYPTWLRICTNYTDLNKACPNDLYPLPSIDQLVDGSSGYGPLSFMDKYSEYHQI